MHVVPHHFYFSFNVALFLTSQSVYKMVFCIVHDGPLVQICSTNPMQSVDRTFQLTRADKDLLSKPEYDVQVGWCIILLNLFPCKLIDFLN